MKIAILDDDELVRISVALLLESLGHTATMYSTEQEMFSGLKAFEPEMMILDQMLGGKRTGIQLVEELRRMYPKLPIVMVSGYPQAELTKAVELHGLSFLAKPFSLDSLTELVSEYSTSKAVSSDQPQSKCNVEDD